MKSHTLSYLEIATVSVLFIGLFGFAIATPMSAGAKEHNNNNIVRVLIAFDKPVGESERALVRANGGKIKYSYTIVNAVAAQVPEAAIEGLSRNPNITAIEVDDTVYAVDIELNNSWGVQHIQSGDVHATPYSNKGTGVKIGIIDSGIDYNHPDLNDNYAGGYDFYYYDNDPMDVYGHGTHVAGTACGEDNDNGTDDGTGKYGIVGVAPNCELYSLRVLNDDGVGYWSDIIASVEWATGAEVYLAAWGDTAATSTQGIRMDIVNLSLGKDRDPGTIVRQAFDNAYGQGLLIVAAAGNSGKPSGNGNNTIYPAKFDSVIAVAATDPSNNRASFSSTGDEVELAAPGVSVYSTWNDSTAYYGTPLCRTEEGRQACYKYGSGTSMASPHVAGAAALVIAAGIIDENGDGNINDEVRSILQSTATDLGLSGRDPLFGFGLVNALAAVFSTIPPATGTIDGAVTDAGTLLPISGVVVTDGTHSATTDINGVYTLTNVSVGTYTVTASATGYSDISQADVVVTENTTTTVDFALTTIVYGSIEGIVTDSGIPIEGAMVTDGTRQVITDAAGYYLISDVPDGTYTVTASATGYQDLSQSVTVSGIAVTNFSLQAVSQATKITVDSIDYSTAGGRYNKKHLNISLYLINDLGDAVFEAYISIDLFRDGVIIASGTGTTDTDGIVTFSLKNAVSGRYKTVVRDVVAVGLTWDGLTPTNEFDK